MHYEITAGNTRNRFSISTQNTQGVLSIAQPLDYQQEKRFLLTISATDSGGRLVQRNLVDLGDNILRIFFKLKFFLYITMLQKIYLELCIFFLTRYIN